MKKEATKMSRAVSQLEHIYNSLNTDFYAGAFPVPIITVQSKGQYSLRELHGPHGGGLKV